MTASASPRVAPGRPPWWRDVRIIRVVLQVAFVLAVVAVVGWLLANLTANLSALGIRRDFAFLDQRAGFAIPNSDFRSSQPIRDALLVGLGNTLRVAVVGVLAALLIGIVVGVSRLSTNWLVRRTASAYVEVLRNVPPLVLLIFFYLAVLSTLPAITDAPEGTSPLLPTNRGVWIAWLDVGAGIGPFLALLGLGVVVAVGVGLWRTRRFDETGRPHHRWLYGMAVIAAFAVLGSLATAAPISLSLPAREGRSVEGGLLLNPEQFSVLIALTLYTSAFLAEIVRGSIQSVPTGQVEASAALGLSWFARLRHVVLPQAMRVATPASGNEFLNLTKNVSLGVVIAYPELLRIARQAVGNGQPAPQLLALVLFGYLALSLTIALITNIANRRLQLVER